MWPSNSFHYHDCNNYIEENDNFSPFFNIDSNTFSENNFNNEINPENSLNFNNYKDEMNMNIINDSNRNIIEKKDFICETKFSNFFENTNANTFITKKRQIEELNISPKEEDKDINFDIFKNNQTNEKEDEEKKIIENNSINNSLISYEEIQTNKIREEKIQIKKEKKEIKNIKIKYKNKKSKYENKKKEKKNDEIKERHNIYNGNNKNNCYISKSINNENIENEMINPNSNSLLEKEKKSVKKIKNNGNINSENGKEICLKTYQIIKKI